MNYANQNKYKGYNFSTYMACRIYRKHLKSVLGVVIMNRITDYASFNKGRKLIRWLMVDTMVVNVFKL